MGHSAAASDCAGIALHHPTTEYAASATTSWRIEKAIFEQLDQPYLPCGGLLAGPLNDHDVDPAAGTIRFLRVETHRS